MLFESPTHLQVAAFHFLHFSDLSNDKESKNDDPDDLDNEQQDPHGPSVGVQVEGAHAVEDADAAGQFKLHEDLRGREEVHVGVVENYINRKTWGGKYKQN